MLSQLEVPEVIKALFLEDRDEVDYFPTYPKFRIVMNAYHKFNVQRLTWGGLWWSVESIYACVDFGEAPLVPRVFASIAAAKNYIDCERSEILEVYNLESKTLAFEPLEYP